MSGTALQQVQQKGTVLVPRVFLPEELPLIWSELEEFLQKTVDGAGGTVTVEYFQDLLRKREAIVFATLRGNRLTFVGIARFADYPTYRVARILAFAGEEAAASIAMLEPLFEAWAFAGGAVEAEGLVKNPVMVRLARRFKYNLKYSVVSKDLRGKLQ